MTRISVIFLLLALILNLIGFLKIGGGAVEGLAKALGAIFFTFFLLSMLFGNRTVQAGSSTPSGHHHSRHPPK